MVETGDVPFVDDEKVQQRFPFWPIMMILVIELCERLCYYTIAGTLRNYMLTAGMTLSASSALTSTFGTVGYGMCLPGGIISDKYGLYRTIFVACIIYVVATTMIMLASVPPIGESFKTGLYVFATCGVMAVGMGGMKPNIMNFGASQITREDEVGEQQRQSFFSWFYVSINIGVFGSFLYLVTLATSGQPPLIPQEWGFFASYFISTIAMALAGLIFVAGTRMYVRKTPNPSPENEMLVVFRTLNHTAKQGSSKAKVALFGWGLVPVFVLTSLGVAFVKGSAGDFLTYFSLGCGTVSMVIVGILHIDNSWVCERPVAGGENAFCIDEVRATLGIVPLMVLSNISFSLSYNAMNAAFPAQACQMNCFISGNTQINGAFFNVGDAFGIVAAAPFFESCMYPFWAKVQGRSVSLGQKIVTGWFIIGAANVVAAVLESARKAAPLMDDRPYSDCAPPNTHMNDLSAWLMFIPFVMCGVAEVFVYPSMYGYAFTTAPVKVRQTVQAFNLVVQGSISNAFTTGLQLALMPDDLNTGNLNKYYYANAAIAFIGMALYALLRRQIGSSREFVKPFTLAENPVLT